MSIFRRTMRIAIFLLATVAAAAPVAWAGGHHHGHYSRSSFSLALGWSLPPPYWSGYGPGYGYFPGYGPAYPPVWAPSYLSLGYGFGSYGSRYGLSFSIPLYFGPRYAPQPRQPAPAPAAPTAYRQADPSCLQVREYQTEIVVGGKSVPAYGDACLQPDGSWKQVSGPFAAD